MSGGATCCLQYTQGKLAQASATQCHPLGGYPIPSRADENKLSTQFDSAPGPEYDQVIPTSNCVLLPESGRRPAV